MTLYREEYLSEIEKRLHRYFSASRDGYKIPAEERHRLEGFMQGAIFMSFATSQDLAELMEKLHFSVFGKTIAERRTEITSRWPEEAVDYSQYDQPAYERKSR